MLPLGWAFGADLIGKFRLKLAISAQNELFSLLLELFLFIGLPASLPPAVTPAGGFSS